MKLWRASCFLAAHKPAADTKIQLLWVKIAKCQNRYFSNPPKTGIQYGGGQEEAMIRSVKESAPTVTGKKGKKRIMVGQLKICIWLEQTSRTNAYFCSISIVETHA